MYNFLYLQPNCCRKVVFVFLSYFKGFLSIAVKCSVRLLTLKIMSTPVFPLVLLQLQRRHEQMKKNLEAQHKELEEKRRVFEEERANWETQQRLEQQKLEASRYTHC